MTETRTFDRAFLERATGGKAAGEPYGDRVVTDSREDVRDALFVALAGPRFDGHDYVDAVLDAGAGGAVVSGSWFRSAGRGRERALLVAQDPLRALQDLSAAHRRRFPIPVAAVTGSNGKTTTKELLAAALSPLGPVHRTRGNRNNHIGLPLTLCDLAPRHRAAVVEIGLNRPGELRVLSALARPRVAVITNVAPAHLEGLGSVDGVARAKAEIADGLEEGGVLVIPAGSEPLRRALAGYRGTVRTFGPGPDADLHPLRVEARGIDGVRLDLPDGTVIRSRIPGEHAAHNLLAALAAAQALGVAPRDAAGPLAGVEPVPGRLQPRRAGDLTVLDDSYNANPASLRAALAVLRGRPGARWAILGDMLELGPDAARLHREAGRDAAFVDLLVTVGELGREIAAGAVEAGLDPGRVREAADGRSAAEALRGGAGGPGTVLVKASRGMGLESAVERLLEMERD